MDARAIDPLSSPKAGLPPTPGEPVRNAKEAAAQVEGIFASMLVGEMRKTLSDGGFFGSAPGSQIFDGMFERLMGEEIARRGGFGLGDFVEQTLKTHEGARQAESRKTEVERTGAIPGPTP
jgi:Rod binding domain-containing protein